MFFIVQLWIMHMINSLNYETNVIIKLYSMYNADKVEQNYFKKYNRILLLYEKYLTKVF